MSYLLALTKLAARVPVMHGTHAKFKKLIAGVGKTNAINDPNPRAVYMATKTRGLRDSVRRFAREAVQARGGEPVIAHAKIDTRHGWRPRLLTAWGRQHIGGIEETEDLVHAINNKSLSRSERGKAWQMLNRGVGSWHNPSDLSASVRVSKHKHAG